MRSGSLILIACLVMIHFPLLTSRAETLSAENQVWVASLASKKECPVDVCPWGVSFEFTVTHKKTGATKQVSFANTSLTIDSMDIWQDILITTGELAWGGQVLTLMDLRGEENQAVDVLTYGISISPGKRYIVYKRHFPRLAPPDPFNTSMILLYDLKQFRDEVDERYKKWGVLGSPILPVKARKNRSINWDLAGPALVFRVHWTGPSSFMIVAADRDGIYYLSDFALNSEGGELEVCGIALIPKVINPPNENGEEIRKRYIIKEVSVAQSGRVTIEFFPSKRVTATLEINPNNYCDLR